MKKTVYLDSSIPSYLFDERDSLKPYIEATKAWWQQERNNFEIHISDETIAELSRGKYPNQAKVLESIINLNVLVGSEHIIDIAQTYMNHYLMPKHSESDALHLAYASFYRMDFLLTWNCNHLANANKKPHIRILNTRLNLSVPEIVTPLQLFKENNDDN